MYFSLVLAASKLETETKTKQTNTHTDRISTYKCKKWPILTLIDYQMETNGLRLPLYRLLFAFVDCTFVAQKK